MNSLPWDEIRDVSERFRTLPWPLPTREGDLEMSMSAATRMLIWSEWRQRRTQFAIGMAWMFIGAVYCIVYHRATGLRSPAGSLFGTTLLYGLAMPIFVAMRTSLGEVTDHTRAFHDGLPVSLQTRGIVKLIGGLVVIVGPIVFAGMVLSLFSATGWLEQAQERAADYEINTVRLPDRPSMSAAAAVVMIWRVTAIAVASASMLYLLLSILGTAMRSESHLGFTGTAVAMVWFLGIGPLTNEASNFAWLGVLLPQSLSIGYSYGTEHGTYNDVVFAKQLTGQLLVNLIVQVVLAMVFVHRYRRRISRRDSREQSLSAPKVWHRWTMPLATRGLALVWLTLRQSVPMCLPGLVIALLMTPFQMDMTGSVQNASLAQRMADGLPSSMWAIGLLWSVVVGAGIFAPELDSRIAEFWRAWPTGTWRLFSVKFFVGLAVVLLVLDGTTIAVSWNSPNWGDYHAMNWPYIAIMVPLHAMMFAVAVAFACWIRRPAVGGMLAMGTFMLTMLVTDWSNATRQFNPIEVYDGLNFANRRADGLPQAIDFTSHNYPAVAAMMAVLTVAMALAGWWALRSYSPRRAVS